MASMWTEVNKYTKYDSGSNITTVNCKDCSIEEKYLGKHRAMYCNACRKKHYAARVNSLINFQYKKRDKEVNPSEEKIIITPFIDKANRVNKSEVIEIVNSDAENLNKSLDIIKQDCEKLISNIIEIRKSKITRFNNKGD